MRISLERLEAFVEAAQAGSFSAAARRLGKSQSTVSNAIANLEIDVGTDLFDRTTRIPGLTPAGEVLLLQAQTVIDRCIAFEFHADNLSAEAATTVAISADVPTSVLLPVLREFEKKYPHVNLTIHNSLSSNIFDMLQSGTAALGVSFASPDYDRSLEFRQLGKLILLHVASPEHLLGKQPIVSFADLRANRRLVYSAHVTGLPSTEYLQSAQTWQVYDFLPLISMTKAGLGWSTIPRQLILDELRSGQLVELQLENYMHTDWLVGVDVVWSRTRRLSVPELWLRDRLQQHAISERGRGGDRTAF